MKKAIVLFLLFSVSLSKLYSQNSFYSEALEAYNNGQYSTAINFIGNPELYKFRGANLIREKAFILKAQSFIELEDYKNASTTLIKLLESNPIFTPTPNLYQEDFYTYFNSIRVKPIILVGVQMGMSYPIYFSTKSYSVYDSLDYSAAYKRNKDKGTKCYAGGAFLQWNFYGNYALVGDFGYSKTSFKRILKREGIDNFELNYSEISYSNEYGLALKKYFYSLDQHPLLVLLGGSRIGGGFGPYLSLGGHYSHLREAQGDVELNYLYTDRQSHYTEAKNLTRNNIDVKNMRNSTRWGIDAALGSSLNLKRGLFSFEVKYLYDITPYTNSNNRYSNSELLFNYYYIDNNVSISRLNVSISFAPILKYSVKSKIK